MTHEELRKEIEKLFEKHIVSQDMEMANEKPSLVIDQIMQLLAKHEELFEKFYKKSIYIQEINRGSNEIEANGFAEGSWKGSQWIWNDLIKNNQGDKA